MQFRELQKVVNERWGEAFDTTSKCCGGTYDQLRISSEERNEFVIGYKEPYYEETWVVHSPENDFEEPVARFGNGYVEHWSHVRKES